MDAGFIQYLAERRGFQPGDTIATKQQYDALYKEYLKDAGGGWQPTSVPVTNAVTGEVAAALLTSPNSATLMSEKQPTMKLVTLEDGKAYNHNPMTGELTPALIKGTTNQAKLDPKVSQFEDIADMMERQRQARAAQGGGGGGISGFLSGIFGGSDTGQPSPTPMPTPEPMPTPAMTNAPAPVMAGTNTPAMPQTPEQIRAAWQSGLLDDATAVRLLRGQR